MTRNQQPTPATIEACAIPFRNTELKLWGDRDSGQVNDWIYASSDKIHQIVLSLPPGKLFRHSERYRTIFGADELYYVISGTLVLANPQTGEVQRLEKGEVLYFHPDTWHHGFSQGSEELRVLEFFAPPPATGSSQAYAQTKPNLSTTRYTQNQWLGRWPMAAEEGRESFTLKRILPQDILWRIEGEEHQIVVGILMSTDKLTVGYVELLPGQSSDPRLHGGDMSLYVLDGRLNALLPELESQGNWFQMEAADGFYVPVDTPYQYFNMSDDVVKFVFGVAPRYLPGGNS
jgi:quercetin dioxygenase-like cupin family protein